MFITICFKEDERILSRFRTKIFNQEQGGQPSAIIEGWDMNPYTPSDQWPFVVPFVTLEGGHNSPPHVFFRHVECNAIGSDEYRGRRVLSYHFGKHARME